MTILEQALADAYDDMFDYLEEVQTAINEFYAFIADEGGQSNAIKNLSTALKNAETHLSRNFG